MLLRLKPCIALSIEIKLFLSTRQIFLLLMYFQIMLIMFVSFYTMQIVSCFGLSAFKTSVSPASESVFEKN